MKNESSATMQRQRAETQPAGTSIRLHIGELVLRGFQHADRHRISDGVVRELTRLMSEGSAVPFHGKFVMQQIDAGAFKVKPGLSPQATGRQIAQAIYRSLQGNGAPSALPVSRAGDPNLQPGAGVRKRGL
jgi:hypothetical protein